MQAFSATFGPLQFPSICLTPERTKETRWVKTKQLSDKITV